MESSGPSDAPAGLMPIREVARLTGVNPITLRAWERRYGLIRPLRTEGGHRLYSAAEVAAVRAIQLWIERGVPVSKVGELLLLEPSATAAAARDEFADGRDRLLEAVHGFDLPRLQQLYGELAVRYPLPQLLQHLVIPLWQELLLNQQTFGGSTSWRFLDGFVRGRARQQLEAMESEAGAIVIAAVSDAAHEFEVLAAALLLGEAGRRMVVLAPGQPLAELALVCDRARPDALVLFSHQPLASPAIAEVLRLARGVEAPVALVGDAAELAASALDGTPVACLGSSAPLMTQRLSLMLEGKLDT